MSALFVGTLPDGIDIKLDVWDDGTHEVALRDPVTRRWGPPTVLIPEATAVIIPAWTVHSTDVTL